MAGRGRGRGRGIAGLSTQPSKPGGIPSQQNTTTPNLKANQKIPTSASQQTNPETIQPSHPNTFQQNGKPDEKLYTPPTNTIYKVSALQASSNSASEELSNLLKKVSAMKKSQILSEIPEAIFKICNKHTTEKAKLMSDFSNILCEKAMKDPDFAMIGAQLCNALWISEETSQDLRTPLFSTVQNEYKKSNELNRDQFYGLTVFLCELYKILKVQGKSLKPLNGPVCSLLKQLISGDKISEDDAFFFFQEIERVGNVIEEDSHQNMEEMINCIREISISKDDILPSTRCRFVQMIELRASRWQMSEQTRQIYDDMNQDLMASGQ